VIAKQLEGHVVDGGVSMGIGNGHRLSGAPSMEPASPTEIASGGAGLCVVPPDVEHAAHAASATIRNDAARRRSISLSSIAPTR
jgi:hypothetical protein